MCLRTGSGPGLQDTIHNPDLEAGGRLFPLEIFTNRDKITAARHAAGESTMVFRPGSNLPVSLPIWKFHATATWGDVPLAGIYTEYADGKIIREVSVDSARAQAAAIVRRAGRR